MKWHIQTPLYKHYFPLMTNSITEHVLVQAKKVGVTLVYGLQSLYTRGSGFAGIKININVNSYFFNSTSEDTFFRIC